MTAERRVPDSQEAVELIEKGVLDGSILYLSDDELKAELAAYRRSGNAPEGPTR